MFGWRLIRKSEHLLWLATIKDKNEEIARLRQERDHERARSEASINALLAKTQNIVLTPAEPAPQDYEKVLKQHFDLFGDAAEEERMRKEEREMLDRVQG